MPVTILKDSDIINGKVVPVTVATEFLIPVAQPNNGGTTTTNSNGLTNSQTTNNTVVTVVENPSASQTANGGQVISTNLQGSTYVSNGPANDGGGINNQSTKITSDDKFPNIYLNIRENTFSNNSLFFKLDNDSLSSVSAGTPSNTWTDSSGVSNLILTGTTANSLQCVSAYGLKFYKLLANKSIANASYAMSPTTYPTYTIFVFALANDGSVSLPYQTNSVHKFTASNFANANLDFINFSPVKTGTDVSNLCRFSLNASTLNSGAYLLNIAPRLNSEILALTPTQASPEFFTNYSNWLSNSGGFISFAGQSVGFVNKTDIKNEICTLSNLYNLRTNLSNSNTPVAVSVNDGSAKTYQNFSLFFVEMYTYMDGAIGNTNQYGSQFQNYPFYNLKYETLVNGVPAFSASLAFDQKTNIPSSSNYNISLSNKYYGTSGGTRADMFLFDYLQGGGRTVTEMKNNSKKAIESLAFKYRNLLLKSTTDLQITNSTSSLAFPPDLSHPFTNFYAVNK
jgi:hypothetical protein